MRDNKISDQYTRKENKIVNKNRIKTDSSVQYMTKPVKRAMPLK